MSTTYLDYIPAEVIKQNSKTVKSYLSKKSNQKPDPKCCPDITVYWGQKHNGKAFHLLKGEYEIIPTNRFGMVSPLAEYARNVLGRAEFYGCASKVITSPKEETEVFYAKYEPTLEMLELSIMLINSKKIPEEKREYEFIERYFLFKNCPAPFDSKGNLAFQREAGRYYNTGFIDYIWHEKAKTHVLMSSQFKAFTSKNNNPKYAYTHDWTIYSFLDYYKTMYPRPVSKVSASVSDVCNALPELSLNLKNYPAVQVDVKNYWNNGTHIEYKNMIWAFSIIDNNYCAFRYLRIRDGEIEEKIRIIVDSKGKASIFKPFTLVDGTSLFRIVSETPYDIETSDTCCYFVGFDDLYKFKRLRYISEMVNDKEALTYHRKSQVSRIITFLRCSVLERFYKAGYKYICNYLLSSASKKSIENLFGVKVSLSASASVYKISGMNKYQLHRLDDIIRVHQDNNGRVLNLQRVMAFLSFMAGNGKTSDLSNEDSDWYFSQVFKFRNTDFTTLLYKTGERNGTLYITTPFSYACSEQYRSYRNLDRFTEEDVKKVLKVMRLQKKADNKNMNVNVYYLFSDCVSLFTSLSTANRPNISLYDCDSFDELDHIHNMLIEIDRFDRDQKAKEADEKLIKKMDKLKEKREEKFSWTDGKYSIVVPESPAEIVEEGHYLHHCVGGYVNGVAEGHTNILFLRQSRYLNVPYYTIEVNNHDEVVQIHGMCNCWLGKAPEAVNSVINWIREKGIKCSVKMVLNLGTGYSPSSSNLKAEEYGLGGKTYV